MLSSTNGNVCISYLYGIVYLYHQPLTHLTYITYSTVSTRTSVWPWYERDLCACSCGIPDVWACCEDLPGLPHKKYFARYRTDRDTLPKGLKRLLYITAWRNSFAGLCKAVKPFPVVIYISLAEKPYNPTTCLPIPSGSLILSVHLSLTPLSFSLAHTFEGGERCKVGWKFWGCEAKWMFLSG